MFKKTLLAVSIVAASTSVLASQVKDLKVTKGHLTTVETATASNRQNITDLAREVVARDDQIKTTISDNHAQMIARDQKVAREVARNKGRLTTVETAISDNHAQMIARDQKVAREVARNKGRLTTVENRYRI